MICHRFRRVFCLFLCFILLFFVHTTVLAEELFEEDGMTNDTTAFYWINHNTTSVALAWMNLNIPTSSTGLTAALLSIGINKWSVGTSSFLPENPSVTATQIAIYNCPSTGWISSSIPSQVFFDDLFPFEGQSEGKVAQTRLFSASNHPISDCDYASTTIAYAEIYYNPTYVNTSNNWINTVAHEVGHCLGFGHHSEDPSVMNPNNSKQISLTEYDQEEFKRKY